MSALRMDAREVVTPVPRATWNAVLARDPDALPTQSPGWTDAACAGGRWADASRLLVAPDGRALVLPMLRRRAAGPAGVEASMPTHWGFGGLLAEGGVTAADVALVLADLGARRIARQTLRPNPCHADLYRDHANARTIVVPRRAHVLDLQPDADAVFAGFASSRRRAIRKAERAGLEVECATDGRLLAEHFVLLAHSEARWAAQQHEPVWLARWRAHFRDTLSKWEAIAAYLNGGCRQWLARHEGRPVASIIVLVGVNAHYTRGAMDKERAGPLRANDLLIWEAIRTACTEGCATFHLGESGASASLADYKDRFGARPVDYPELRLERAPISATDRAARSVVKRVIGFREP